MESQKTTPRVPIRDLVLYYLKLGTLGFGGPVALVEDGTVLVAVEAAIGQLD